MLCDFEDEDEDKNEAESMKSKNSKNEEQEEETAFKFEEEDNHLDQKIQRLTLYDDFPHYLILDQVNDKERDICYFEVEVSKLSEKGDITIGFVKKDNFKLENEDQQLGDQDDTVGFSLANGYVTISNELIHEFENEVNQKKLYGLKEYDHYDFGGDTIGVGYVKKSGHIFVTLNGVVLNK